MIILFLFLFCVHHKSYWRFKMYKDEIVEEVRRNREKLFARFDYDMKKFSAYIMEAQKKEKRKIITLEEMRASKSF